MSVAGRSWPVRVAIAGGGTGGHTAPAVALAEALRRLSPPAEVLMFSGSREADARLPREAGLDSVLLDAPRMASGLGLPIFGARFAGAVTEARRELVRFGADVVVGTGGYASAPPALAARLLGMPVVLLEQNAVPGRANRLLARFAAEVHTQFEESRSAFPPSARVLATGNPVRASVLDAARRRARRNDGRFTLLVIGGSQGSRSVNNALADALDRFAAAMPQMCVLHCSGPRDKDAARARFLSSGLAGKVWGFCPTMDELYARADLAVSRAGATTISELAACGVPAILVPYPHASDDHQSANARVLERAGACEIVRDSELNGRSVARRVLDLAGDPVRRARLSAAIRAFARPRAAEAIARRVQAVAWRQDRRRQADIRRVA